MRRFLQVTTRSVVAAANSNGWARLASLESARSLGLKLDQRRAFSLSQLQYSRRGGSSSTDDTGDNKEGKTKRGDNKRGLWDMASEKLSNVGAKTRSAAHKVKDASAHLVDHSMSGSGSSSQEADRSGKKRSLEDHDYDTRNDDDDQRRARSSKRSSSRGNDLDDHDHDNARRRVDLKRGSSSKNSVNKRLSPSSKAQSDSGDGRSSRKTQTTDHRAGGSIRHDKNMMRFVLDLGENQVARIDYRPAGKNVIELYHTEVPENLRGRGIGRALAKGAFETASKADLKLRVTCSYLEDYLRHHSKDKYKKLLE